MISSPSIQDTLSSALISGNLTRLEVELLLAHILNVSRCHLRARPEKIITEEQKRAFDALVFRRNAGEPTAYLVGAKEFWSLPLLVSKQVLIPRPETECLVELVLGSFSQEAGNRRVLDLGTGSGAIALALGTERPDWNIIGIDNSVSALEVASQNAKNNQITNVEFRESDWFSCFERDKTPFDVIVGNPPYLAADDVHLLGSLRYEPKRALVSFPDGLQDLQKIINEAPRYLASKGWLFLEHGFAQGAAVRKIFELANFVKIKTYQDLSGLDRVTAARKH